MTQGFARVWRLGFVLFLIAVLLTPDWADAARGRARRGLLGVNDPRYASLIMNPETGEIYHSRNAEIKRVPASLTKMMTLYLLFESIEAGKARMDTKLKVSDKASMQPQTNISLTSFDKVPVELAIKALVVRSANDVAVVVAEYLGGSVDGFATMMTNKARALGMPNTIFKNPHGLPDSRQITTAKDMAKLAIALKRDFPQYYHFFSTKQFSWRGVTYYTHNRVMLRYSGTDGVKTGYTIKSGFNVVTSSTRGGRPLLGVVLGGGTARWRDDRMIALMNQGYTTLAKKGQKPGKLFADNLPLQRNGLKMGEVEVVVAPTNAPPGSIPIEQVMVVQGQPQMNVLPGSLDGQQALRSAGMESGLWGIQVGAFSSKSQAEQAALNAFNLAPSDLQGSRISVIGTGTSNSMIHRARLENISEDQAKKACELLVSRNSPCFIFRAGAQNL